MRGLLLLTLLSGCWLGAWPDEAVDTRVGFVYLQEEGPWFRAAEEGRLALDAEPSVWTHARVVDSDEYLEVVEADRSQVVLLAHPGLEPEAQELASAWPELPILRVGAARSQVDVALSGRMYQGWYAVGVAADQASATGRLAVLATEPTPQEVRCIDALTLGALSVDPSAQVELSWLGASPSPSTESTAAREAALRGADVLLGLTDTDTVPQTAALLSTQSAPVWSLVAHHDELCGPTCLTGVVWRWEGLYAQVLAGVQSGNLGAGDSLWQPSDQGAVELLPLPESLDLELQALVDQTWADLTLTGSEHLPFEGPLVDTEGSLRLSEGEAATDADLAQLCWLVQGVVDADDQPALLPPGCGGER